MTGKKIKVLFVTRGYSQNAGGMERFSYEMIKRLSRHERIDATVIAYTGHRLLAPFFVFSGLTRVLAAARKSDVVHLGDPLLSLQGWMIKKLYKTPVAVTVHGLDILYPNFVYQIYWKTFGRKFDLYLPISRYVSELLKNSGVKRTTNVVKPGIEDLYFDPKISRDGLAGVLKTDLAAKKVLFTSGRLVERKGHAWFIKNVLPKLPNNFLYVIAGNGPQLQVIRQKIDSLGLKDRVWLLGRVSAKDLKTLYNTIDIFIQPNISIKGDVEGFGLVLLEAALCGRQVLASRLEGMTDAVVPGKNGESISAEDATAWTRAISNAAARASFVPEARAYTLAHFTWESAAQDYARSLASLS